MARAVQHLNLHRIGATELRVISDVDAGVLPIIQEEERVIRDYTQHGHWTQRMVSLFILKDLQPLSSQIQAGGALPAGDMEHLDHRTVINVYDLADPSTCHIFVNQQAMVAAGYWHDLAAIRGLLAHEHAHPLAENETTLASRRIQLATDQPDVTKRGGANLHSADLTEQLDRILTELVGQICLRAPREIFTNELAIRCGFADVMLHLNHQNVANAVRSLAGREGLRQRLAQDVADGLRPARETEQLLLIGDLKSYLNLTIEIAPFYRAGRTADARELEQTLDRELFPHLASAVGQAYRVVRDRYVALPADLTPEALLIWSQELLNIVLHLLGEQQVGAGYRLHIAPS
jgi:hypothetical protein